MELFLKDTDSSEYRWPEARKELYSSLASLQSLNSDRKLTLVRNLAKEHPDSFSKLNIDKWKDHLKIINQAFDDALDILIKSLMEEAQASEGTNQRRFESLREKLNYIEKSNPDDVEALILEKCEPCLKRLSLIHI